MQIIRPDINIDFVGKRKLAMIFSWVLILIGMGTLVVRGPNYGIDFAGGTLVQVKFDKATNAGDIKDALKGVDLGSVIVQQFGDQPNEFLIKAQNTSAELEGLSQKIKTSLEKVYGANTVDLRRAEMVGPQVGKDLRQKGLMALVWAMIGTLIYITWRFEFRFGVGAVIATVHDVLITLGAFAVFHREIDLTVIAAFLAIMGYSLNDTIIVCDRIRENMGKHAKDGLSAIINRSVNETLSRTLLTSGTTLLVIISLFIFGGGVIHGFAFAMLVGVLIGTYSSIFVASPVILFWEGRKKGDGKTGDGKTAAVGRSA
jgi:preprotein translocase subunit SecF